MDELINLNERRKNPGDTTSIYLDQLDRVDLRTVCLGDWIEGIGDVNSYTFLGLLHHLGNSGFKIIKVSKVSK